MPEIHQIQEALLIRRIEESFLYLFSQGKLNGTVHTSIGQEFSAIAFAGQLTSDDFIFSNHRCHGHFISYTKNHFALLAELLGKKAGVCGGVGSSQHLQQGNFYSNGVQGGITPLAAGMALANKLRNSGHIGIVFIGDGTLGEGVLYETLNIISLWQLPLLIVCENNLYAQSTNIKQNLSGDITSRAHAFSIKTSVSDTWDIDALLNSAKQSVDFVRQNQQPLFHLVNTYRLSPHSKSDDNREPSEIKHYHEKDFLNQFANSKPEVYKELLEGINEGVNNAIQEILTLKELTLDEYLGDTSVPQKDSGWTEVPEMNERQVNLINKFFHEALASHSNVVFIGEDVLSPYGGAFKVAKGLSEKFPDRVFTTPISEAAITGIGNGLALAGYKPFVEIMFGDFITLAFDQIVNHASKFTHMYNHKAHCPIVIRTPMGGRRGYGPTHSQTLDRFLIGLDNIQTVALNTYVNPEIVYREILKENNPVIVLENKVDYGKHIGQLRLVNYTHLMSTGPYPVVKLSPINSRPDITLVTYGGMATEVVESVPLIFHECDLRAEVIIMTKINPVDYHQILESVEITRKLVVVEEGTTVGGISSEIVSGVAEKCRSHVELLKIGALPVPIPSVKSLEEAILPSRSRIVRAIIERFL